MVAIAFRFPAGRYHATPWGRHVNEAEVEWPPSPWRILRGLVATFYRKGHTERHDTAAVDGLIETLAETLPAYALPRAVRSHSRHYMPQGRFKGGREDTALVFDAFVRVEPDTELVVDWPATLDISQRALLEALVRDLGFLGRAESWVEAYVLDEWQGTADCMVSTASVDADTGEVREPVRLIAPTPPTEYSNWRANVVAEHGLDGARLKRAEQRILDTLPETLPGALRNETGDLQAAGWSSPPGARFVTYQRPLDAFTAKPGRRRPSRFRPVTAVRLALAGRPLPRIEDAIRIGELTRMAAIKKAELVCDGPVPPVLSGHGLPEGNLHGHAFYLPEDADGDGHIDHVLVHASDRLPADAMRALDRIGRLWERDGGEWSVLFEGYGDMSDFGDSIHTGASRRWQSVTPYLHPWHLKKRFGIADQIARECRARGLSEPDVDVLAPPVTGTDGRRRRPAHFRRFRTTRKRLVQPDTRGRFVCLTFPHDVEGPLALGFACHYGLGMFRAIE